MVAYARHRQRLSELFGDRLLRMNLFAQDGQIPAAALQANLESELCSRELKSCDPTPDVTLRFHELLRPEERFPKHSIDSPHQRTRLSIDY